MKKITIFSCVSLVLLTSGYCIATGDAEQPQSKTPKDKPFAVFVDEDSDEKSKFVKGMFECCTSEESRKAWYMTDFLAARMRAVQKESGKKIVIRKDGTVFLKDKKPIYKDFFEKTDTSGILKKLPR